MYGYRDNHGYRDQRDDRTRERNYHKRERSSSRDDHKKKRRRSRSQSNPRYHHHKQRSRSRSREKRQYVDSYEEKSGEEIEQKLRLAIRNNEIQFDAKLLEMLRNLPTGRQQQLTIQAHSSDKISEFILVRQLFISGLSQMNEGYIQSIMKQYGEIEKIQIIKNFAYVKFHKVEDASNACAEYHKINATIHNNTYNNNFKIFFADHVKRWNVVSNSSNFENKDDLVPVIYASIRGQMPFNNEQYLREIFGKFGFVRNIQIKMNELPGPKTYKSYILIQYETLTQAIRARERIKLNREHYLGDRKSEVTILIDSQKLTRDWPNVKNQLRYQRNKHLKSLNTGIVPQIPLGSSFGGNINMPIQQAQPANSVVAETNDIFDMIREYAEKQQQIEQQQSDWMGFMTRNKQFKVQVDFKLIHKVPFELDTLLNVSHRADVKEGLNREDYVMAGKFRAANALNMESFNEYIRYFRKKNKAGIIVTRNYLIYLIPSMEDLSLPYPIRQDELLAIFFKIQ